MLISEIFYSIQGEGELTGVPSVFVRSSGCNLRCAWCDTPYASWNPEGDLRTVPQILAEVQTFQAARHVVQFLALAGGIHEKQHDGMRAFLFRMHNESIHRPIRCAQIDLVLDHADISRSGSVKPYSVASSAT